MKKVFALLLALLCLFCFSSFASSYEYLENYYACFFDAHRLGQLTGVEMNFDTLFMELFFTNKDDVVYYSQKKWVDGRLIETDLASAAYDEHGKNFTLTLPDGTVFSGYWEDDASTVWLDIGAGYFKFHHVEYLNPFQEWKR